jgi:hypothetical protein
MCMYVSKSCIRVTIVDLTPHLASFYPNVESCNPNKSFIRSITTILKIYVLKKCDYRT